MTFREYKDRLRGLHKQAGLFDRFRNPVKRYQDAITSYPWSPFNPDVCQNCKEPKQPTQWHWRHAGDWYDKYRPEEWDYTISPYVSDGIGPRPVQWTYGQGTPPTGPSGAT